MPDTALQRDEHGVRLASAELSPAFLAAVITRSSLTLDALHRLTLRLGALREEPQADW